jgi:hypothetical protein
MKAPLPTLLHRAPRALRALGPRGVASPLPVGRRRLHAPRAVADGSVGNAAPLPAATTSSGLSPTPGSCNCGAGAVDLLTPRARCVLSRPRLAVFAARRKPFANSDSVHEAWNAGGVDREG